MLVAVVYNCPVHYMFNTLWQFQIVKSYKFGRLMGGKLI